MSSSVLEHSFSSRLARELELVAEKLEQWINAEHKWPFDPTLVQQLQQLLGLLKHEVQRLKAGKVYVVIVLMGGTGVGKSTLLNALAGQPIARTGLLRPTTRQVLAYIHTSLPGDILPAQLLEQAVRHDQDILHNKVIVDAPDLDSRETENYRRLRSILPYADIVLYIGSSEKYHDRIGWELFREFSGRKAFAFVLNRWDECVGREQTGERPDLDWLRDLEREGYEHPLLFRTSARYWTSSEKLTTAVPPPGDQFQELRQWLEAELGEKELLAIREKNLVETLRKCAEHLEQLLRGLTSINLPSLEQAWKAVLERAVQQFIERCESYFYQQQKRLDDYLREQATKQIPGWLSSIVQWWRGWRVSRAAPASDSSVPSYLTTHLTDLVCDLLPSLGDSYLRHWGEHLTNQLLEQAANHGLPASFLEESLRQISPGDWNGFWKEQLREALRHAHQGVWQGHGWRSWLHRAVKWMPGRLSWLAGFFGLSVLLYRMFFAAAPYNPGFGDVLYFLVPWFLVEVLSYFLAYRLSPHDWRDFTSHVIQGLRHGASSALWQIYGGQLSRVESDRNNEVNALKQILEQLSNVLQSIEQRRQEIAAIKRLYVRQLQAK